METAAAWARLKAMTDADSEPVLSASDLDILLDMAALADSADNAPSSADWTPTYDLNRAAAEGWRWKAGRLATRFDFSADGASYHRSQAVAACERMAEQYRRRIVSSAPVYAAIAAAYPDDEDE